MDAIDLHAHFLTSEYVAALSRHGALERDGFPLPSWDADEHLRFMDEAGIATAMLSLSSPHPWFSDASEATELARSVPATPRSAARASLAAAFARLRSSRASCRSIAASAALNRQPQ